MSNTHEMQKQIDALVMRLGSPEQIPPAEPISDVQASEAGQAGLLYGLVVQASSIKTRLLLPNLHKRSIRS